MLDAFKKIFSIQGIVTVLLTLIFCHLSMTEKISSQQFMTIFTAVIAFYFGSQMKDTKR